MLLTTNPIGSLLAEDQENQKDALVYLGICEGAGIYRAAKTKLDSAIGPQDHGMVRSGEPVVERSDYKTNREEGDVRKSDLYGRTKRPVRDETLSGRLKATYCLHNVFFKLSTYRRLK